MHSATRPQLLKGLTLATLASGTLDAAAGIVVFDFALGRMSIVQILQWIASGVFGAESFNMGLGSAAYGMFFHFVIAFGFSAGLFAFYKKFPVIRDYPVFSGLAYGGYIWIAMNFIVLPLSQTPVSPFEPGVALTGYIWHMLFTGLPISMIARRTFEQK